MPCPLRELCTHLCSLRCLILGQGTPVEIAMLNSSLAERYFTSGLSQSSWWVPWRLFRAFRLVFIYLQWPRQGGVCLDHLTQNQHCNCHFIMFIVNAFEAWKLLQLKQASHSFTGVIVVGGKLFQSFLKLKMDLGLNISPEVSQKHGFTTTASQWEQQCSTKIQFNPQA